MTLLSIKNLSKKYKRAEGYAVKNFSLEVEKGEMIALLGESGCGKTTVLRLISGFEIPEEGSIFINNRTVFDKDTFTEPEKRGVGIVFQDYALFPHLSVMENITFGLYKMSKQERKKRADQLLELIGLKGYEKRYTHELSGGQRQRVALARALAPDPEIVLMDEPFSNIDALLKEQMRKEIREIMKSTGTTCIFVTHDTRDVMTVADRVVVMKSGEVIQFGTPAGIYMHPADSYVARFFGKTNLLRAKVCKDGFDTPIGFIKSDNVPENVNEVMLSIRPESFKMVKDNENCICGKLKNVNFCGEYQEVVCTVPDQEGNQVEVTLYVHRDKPCHEYNGQCYFQAIKEQIQVLQFGKQEGE